MEVDSTLREDVYDHGMALNPRNDKVQCNYCGMVVAGFHCLQIHLGGINRKCKDAPLKVKELFKSALNIVEEKIPAQKDGNFFSADRPTNSIANSKEGIRKRGKAESSHNDEPKDSKRIYFDSSMNRNDPIPSASNFRDEFAAQKKSCSIEGIQSSSVMIKRWVGRFLIENGIEFDAAKSYSFKKMMEVASNASDIKCNIPSIQELEGWIFSEELKETKNYEWAIKGSWSKTGCSIMLDEWIDDRGRNLLIVVADCPLGAIYIQSFDISTLLGDVEGFLLLLEGVLSEVGIQNVVQIVAHTSSKFMDVVGQRLTEKHRSIFWAVSASHCIGLMLENIGLVSSVKQVLDKAKAITEFIYSRADVLKLTRSHTCSFDLVKSSKIKAATPFLTLENILIEKENLETLVSSSQWTHSSWASNVEGRRVGDLLHDRSFWDRVSIVVRATIPLVNVLSLVNGDGNPHVGFIYETMDQVKETISDELESIEDEYMPYWSIIDDIWNNILHSPLHAAGYFLNPGFLYTEDFCTDSEVAGGLLTTIVRMVEDTHTQDLVTKQLELYRRCQGDFKRGTKNDKQISMPPAEWWSSFGSQCPDLRKLAVRILSQSCNGAESYGLKKEVAEKLLSCSDGRNQAEQQKLTNLAYMHYNMILKHKKIGGNCDVEAGETDSVGDCIINEFGKPEDAALHKKDAKRTAAMQGGPSDKPKKVEL